VGDVVGINVWSEKDLNTDTTVRPDGTITMPLVGDLRAAGVTPTALKAKIRDEVSKLINKVQANEITVAVKAWKSYRFVIQGEVETLIAAVDSAWLRGAVGGPFAPAFAAAGRKLGKGPVDAAALRAAGWLVPDAIAADEVGRAALVLGAIGGEREPVAFVRDL